MRGRARVLYSTGSGRGGGGRAPRPPPPWCMRGGCGCCGRSRSARGRRRDSGHGGVAVPAPRSPSVAPPALPPRAISSGRGAAGPRRGASITAVSEGAQQDARTGGGWGRTKYSTAMAMAPAMARGAMMPILVVPSPPSWGTIGSAADACRGAGGGAGVEVKPSAGGSCRWTGATGAATTAVRPRTPSRHDMLRGVGECWTSAGLSRCKM